MKQFAALVTAAALLGGSAQALFGKSQEKQEVSEEAPVVQDIQITTYRGIPYQAQFLGSDSQGDDLTFAVSEEPDKGSVEVDGVNFTYMPEEDASGGDRFTYTATDSAGNVSAPATVTVTIEKVRSGVTYADTDASSAAAAQYLAEEGIFTGCRMGEAYYFQPEETVSRSEFLAMAMETAGLEAPAVTMTGFCDDAAIPTWAKAYAAAGVAEGIVQGKTTDQGAAFLGDETVTFNEAAAMLDRVLGLEDVDLEVWYADRQAVPSWAAQAVGNLEAVSVLSAGSFGSAGLDAPVTRADAARMLCAAGTLLAGEEEPQSLFDWLR